MNNPLRHSSSHDLFAPPQDVRRSAVTISSLELEKLGMPDQESSQFLNLRRTYLQKEPIDWNNVQIPPDDFFHPYSSLKDVDRARAKEVLSKLVVVCFNGGLGLRMGCHGSKSSLQILKKAGLRDPLTFLDCKVMHIEELNNEFDVDIPLVLMNSFNTDEQTKQTVQKYKGRRISIHTFCQSKFPLMFRDTLAMVAGSEEEDEFFYPPGSGDVFKSIERSGLLAEFKKDGKEYMFLSNVENLGATVDVKILDHFVSEQLDFLLEVTNRISTDSGGGLPIQMATDDRVHIMETSQIPPEMQSKFSMLITSGGTQTTFGCA
jgi:UTP--glucose-1-phosphate uridylyltransferase